MIRNAVVGSALVVGMPMAAVALNCPIGPAGVAVAAEGDDTGGATDSTGSGDTGGGTDASAPSAPGPEPGGEPAPSPTDGVDDNAEVATPPPDDSSSAGGEGGVAAAPSGPMVFHRSTAVVPVFNYDTENHLWLWTVKNVAVSSQHSVVQVKR